MARSLTPKQAVFVREYLVSLNATQAAIKAGYSVKNADTIGSELLGKTGVAQAIQTAQTKRAERTERKAGDVLHDIQRCTQLAMEKEDLKAAFKGLELEGKHLGMFTDRVANTLSGSLIIEWGHDG